MGCGWQEIDKTFDLGYIRVAGLHHECKPTVLVVHPTFERPRTMTHTSIRTYVHTVYAYKHMYVHTVYTHTKGTLKPPIADSPKQGHSTTNLSTKDTG